MEFRKILVVKIISGTRESWNQNVKKGETSLRSCCTHNIRNILSKVQYYLYEQVFRWYK